MPPIEGGAPPPDTGTERAAERAYSRTEVRAAVRRSLRILKRTIPADADFDDPEIKRKLWNIQSIESAVSRTTGEDKNKDTFENTFQDPETGETFTQQEGIPVEALIDVLNDKISRERNTRKRASLEKQREVLLGSSLSYDEAHADEDPKVKHARLQQEAQLIHQDSRNTGTQDGDWFVAENTLRNRRELRFLPIAGGEDPEPPIPTPPVGGPPPPDSPPIGPPTPSTTDTVEPPIHEVVIANRDIDAWKNARELAQKLIAKEQRAGSIFNPLTWGRKLGLKRFEMYWEQKLTRQIHDAAVQSGNAYVGVDVAASTIRLGDFFRANVNNLRIDQTGLEGANRRAAQSQVENIKTQHREGITDSGAEATTDRRDLIEVTGPLRDRVVSELLRPIIRGETSPFYGRQIQTPEDVHEALISFMEANQNDPQIRQLFGETNLYGNASEMFATDLLEMANTLRAHGYATREIDEKVKILFANPEWAAKSDATFGEIDNFVRWAQAGRIRGAILNPTVVSIGMSLGLAGLKSAAQKLSTAGVVIGAGTILTSPLSAPLAGVMVGATWAAAERNANLKKDRTRHQREKGAYGEQMPRAGEAPRREALDEYQYFTASADTLLNGFRDPATQTGEQQELASIIRENPMAGIGPDRLVGDDRRGIRELLSADLTNPDNRTAVIRRIAEIRARLDSNQDLITFEGKTQVEQGRLGLVLAIVQARSRLREPDAGMTADQIRVLESEMTGQWNARFSGNQAEQDRRFAHYRLRQSLLSGAIGGAIGLGTAFVSQEVLTATARGVPTLDNMPVVGALINSGRTIRENIMDGKPLSEWDFGGHNPDQIDYAQTQELVRNPTTSLEVRPGIYLEHANDGSYSLKDSAGAEVYTGGIRVEDNGNIVINSPEKSGSIPQSLKELMTQPGVTINEREIPWPGPELYAKGGTQDLSDTIALRVTIDSAQNRIVELIDTTNNTIIPSPPLRVESDGRFIVEQGFDKLPDNLKALFNQTGWTREPVDGRLATDFNIDKAKDFANNYVDRGGRLGLNSTVDFAIDPEARAHLGETDNAITFTDKTQKLVDPHPGWINKDGTFIFAGEKSQMSAEAQTLLGNMEARETTEHNLRHAVAEIAKGGPINARDEVIVQGSISLNTHDTHTGFLNEDLNPDGSKANLVYDEFAQRHNRIDSVTGKVEVGKMSFSYKPQLASEGGEIWVNGFLQQDGKIHVDQAYAMGDPRFPDNTTIAAEKWDQIYSEMKKEGWTIEDTNTPGHKIITPPTATAYTPPTFEEIDPAVKGTEIVLVAPLEQSPALPVVEAPRLPLELLSAEVTPRYYMMYGGHLPEERKRIFEKNRSETLKNNPEAILDHRVETAAYFASQTPEHMAEVQRLAEQITTPPSENLRAMICIPVADHQEQDNIYESLKNYTYQTAPKDQYEIILFLNHPTSRPDGSSITPDRTRAEIERFQRDFPDMPIRIMSETLPLDKANIGYVRKAMNDAALYRQYQRGEDAGDIILVSNDADNKGIAPAYIENFINKFDENPEYDLILGQLDWDPEAYTKNPGVHLGTRLFQYLNTHGRKRVGSLVSSGANTAFKGSIYAGIGGYVSGISGEDIAIGQAITEARGVNTTLGYGGARVSRLYTSARRAVDALRSGLVPVAQWDKGFSAFDDEIRRLNTSSGADIDYNDAATVERVKAEIEKVLDRTIEIYDVEEGLGKEAEFYQNALRYMGIQYKLTNGHVEIINMDSMAKRLQHYQKIGVLLRDIKSGKGTPAMQAELERLQQELH